MKKGILRPAFGAEEKTENCGAQHKNCGGKRWKNRMKSDIKTAKCRKITDFCSKDNMFKNNSALKREQEFKGARRALAHAAQQKNRGIRFAYRVAKQMQVEMCAGI